MPGVRGGQGVGEIGVTAEKVTILLTLFHKMIWLKKNSIGL